MITGVVVGVSDVLEWHLNFHLFCDRSVEFQRMDDAKKLEMRERRFLFLSCFYGVVWKWCPSMNNRLSRIIRTYALVLSRHGAYHLLHHTSVYYCYGRMDMRQFHEQCSPNSVQRRAIMNLEGNCIVVCDKNLIDFSRFLSYDFFELHF